MGPAAICGTGAVIPVAAEKLPAELMERLGYEH